MHNFADTTAPTGDMQLVDAAGRTATLIHCNREQDVFDIPTRDLVKSQSKDSGGSFDSSDSDERLIEASSTDTSHARKQTTTFLRPSIVLDASCANSDTARPSDCVTRVMTLSMEHAHSGEYEQTHGNCQYSYTNVSRSSAHSISPIFSRLAKDLRSRRAHLVYQHTGVGDGVPVKSRVSDDSRVSHIMEDPVDSSEVSAHTQLCTDGQTGEDMVEHNCRQYEYLSSDYCTLPVELSSDGFVKRFSRSVSDSGRSTASNELSDSEKRSLSCSRSSEDMRRSSLSLDMGISVSSVESLEEGGLTEPGESPHGASRVVAGNAAQATRLNPCRPGFHLHEPVADPAGRVVHAREARLCWSGISADSEVGDHVDLAGELPVTSNTPKCPALDGSCNTTSCLAGGGSTRTRTVVCTRRKRDFHSWENHLVNGIQGGCDLHIYELAHRLDLPSQQDQNPSVSSPSPDSGSKIGEHSPEDVNLGTYLSSRQQTSLGDCPSTQHPRLHEHAAVAAQPTQAGRPTTLTVAVCSNSRHSPSTDVLTLPCYSSALHTIDNDSTARCVSSKSSSYETSVHTTIGPHLAKSATNRAVDSISPAKSGVTHSDQISTSPHNASPDTVSRKTCFHTIPPKACAHTIPPKTCADLIPPETCTDTIPPKTCNDTIAPKTCTDTIAPKTCNDTISPKACAHKSCLSMVFRRMSSPGKNVASLLSTNKCKYDVQDATLGYMSPAKPGRQRTLMQKFASTKSSSFDAASSTVATCHLKNSPSSPLLLSSSSSSPCFPKRFRSISVDAYSATRRHVNSTQEKVLGSSSRSSEDVLSRQDDTSEEDLLEQTWFDAQKSERNRVSYPYDGSDGKAQKKAQQFGLSLQDIKNNTGRIIPLPVEETVEYLKSVGGDEVEGLFRRCARVSTMREVQERYDDGERIDFQVYSDPHLAAAILKKFLRELQEPLMTYDLFEPITRLHYLEAGKQLSEVQRILQDELPEDNYIILKYVFQFLRQVVSKADVNHMTAENIATVFGPNIAWPKGQTNLAAVEQAVKFSLILVQNFDDVFLR